MFNPYTVFNKLRKQTLQVLKGSKIKRMYIEVHPEVMKAMETLMKREGALFPEVPEGSFYVRANESMHVEKYIVKPLPDRRVQEVKKNCKVMK